jgi:hypothetical protein
MIVFGVLLIVIAVGAVTVALMAPSAASPAIELTAVGLTVSASPLAMFVGGAMSVVLLCIGFALVNRGTRRRARARKELKELRKDHAAAETRTADADAPASPTRTADADAPASPTRTADADAPASPTRTADAPSSPAPDSDEGTDVPPTRPTETR